MQSVKPLRLKRETYRAERKADSHNVAQVWVDSGLSHLDGLYSYRIPNDLLDKVSIGSRVKVPFNSRSCEAMVVELNTTTEHLGNLKVIESLLGDIPVANSKILSFYSQMAKYWASDPYSLISSGIPSRVASVERDFPLQEVLYSQNKARKFRTIASLYLMHSPHVSPYVELANLAVTQSKNGSVLLLLPDVKDVARVQALLHIMETELPIIRLDSSLSRSDRYSNYLFASVSDHAIVIGTRSALFAPIQGLNSIVVAFEKSEQYYEQKHPYWNVRDSVRLRASFESCNVFFTGYVPSAEMAYQIENREVKFLGEKQSIKTLAFPQEKGELLPGRIISEVRKALNQGTVLFLVPRKGYANALLCAKCKNLSLCECGARLFLRNQTADPVCSICAKEVKDWKCKWCSGTTKYAAARGIERFSEEIGKAFPNTGIQISSAPNILEEISEKTKIVIATAGSIPGSKDGYSSVVILEGQRFLSSASSTCEEMVYESFFDATSRVSKNGGVLLVLDSFHPVVSAISRWNPSLLIRKILRESIEADLPPFTTTAVLKLPASEGVMLRNGILKSIKDGRLPDASKVYLTQIDSSDEVRILISVPRENRNLLVDFVHVLSRKRAVSKKSPMSIAIDPYALLG
jgi:primosomal protein N' (replication factor Y)